MHSTQDMDFFDYIKKVWSNDVKEGEVELH